jgi:hypothetical protein
VVRIFKTKTLARFTKRERIGDAALADAIDETERGLVDADLGGCVIKKRVARAGQGKSGGYRMLIAFRTKHRAVFLFGFSKNELDNVDDKQLATLQETAAYWLAADVKTLGRAIADGILIEVQHDD